MSALKRVERFVETMEKNLPGDHEEPRIWSRATGGYEYLTRADLREVVRLAKLAPRDLPRAVRLLERAGEVGYILEVDDVLAALSPVSRKKRAGRR